MYERSCPAIAPHIPELYYFPLMNEEPHAFEVFNWADKGNLDLSKDRFPAFLKPWSGTPVSHESPGASFFGFVWEGQPELNTASGTFHLKTGMYFAVPDKMRLAGKGKVLLIQSLNHSSFFHLGGPVEQTGRLQYIDGCTDSLLIPPVIKGDPCLNLLHIPPGTFQSQHTHPSYRIGLILKGSGHCLTPEPANTYKAWPLQPGMLFHIPAGAMHSFRTTDEDLLVIAFHPDSDFGPTHQNHPMINRTLIPETHEMS